MVPFYLSPNAVGLIPVLILQLIFLLFLLHQPKSTAVYFLIAWLTSMFLVILSNFLAYAIYAPASGYFMGIASMVASLLAATFWIQFAYHFPGLCRPREARFIRIFSLGITLFLALWATYEIVALPVIRVYGFKDFYYGYFNPNAETWLTSPNLFNVLHPLGYLWSLGVWARQTAVFNIPFAGQASLWFALRHPQGQEARAARAFFLLTLSAFVPVLGSILEGANVLPPGTFPTLYLGVMTLTAVTYINHSPQPTSFMVKLVGIPLVILLLAMGILNRTTLDAHIAAYHNHLFTDLNVVGEQLRFHDLFYAPAHVAYVLQRPLPADLLSPNYQLRYAATDAIQLETLQTEDQWLQDGMRQRSVIAYWATWHAFPWLTSAQLGQLQQGTSPPPPPAAISYRGMSGDVSDHYLRYFFTSPDHLYEVGFSYADFRGTLHQAALPLVALTFLMSTAVLVLLPLFYRANLVRPLENLLAGVRRVERGDLHGRVPRTQEDEIGYLTGAFNNMVGALQQEIAERKQAEEMAVQLNITLEQRVQERTRDLQVLYDVSAAASHILDLDTLLTESLTKSVSALDGLAGAVYLLRDGALHLAQAYQWPPEVQAETAVFPPNHPFTQWTQQHNQPRLIAHIADYLPTAATLPIPLLPLICPLQIADEKLGLLVVVRPQGQGFNVEDIALVTSLAEQMAGAVQAAKLRRQAQRTAVLEERERIARDLHDSVTQALYGLVTFAEVGQAQLETGAVERVAPTFARIGATTRQALKEMRLFIHQLRPDVLAEEGLIGALHLRLAAVEGRANIQARLLADETISLPPEVEAALYQIAQEALNNTLRHAGATTITLYLGREKEQVVLEIRDDGRGFDPTANGHNGDRNGGMGLPNMHKRAADIHATLKIISFPSHGTRVRVEYREQEEL